METDTKREKAFFVLKLTGIDLKEVSPVDLAELLKNFSKLIGNDKLEFDSIYKGSAVLKIATPSEYLQDKLNNFHQNVVTKKNAKEIEKIINKYSIDYPNIVAQALINTKSANDEDLESFYEFNHKSPTIEVFEQQESFRGKIAKLTDGKDKSDHVTIRLASDKTVNIELNKELTAKLVKYIDTLWNAKYQVEFTGIAQYEYIDIFNFTLKSFKATSFEIIEYQSANEWFDELRECGESGWNAFTDPQKTWIEELRS